MKGEGQKKTCVVGGSASKDLARKLAKKIKGGSYIDSELRVFPDGESKVSLKKKPAKGTNRILVVQSACPPVDSNLIQVLALIEKCTSYTPNVYAVIPYMGYARQDKEFLSGEAVTIKAIAKMIKAAGAKKVFVVDIHSSIALTYFGVSIKNVTAMPALVDYFEKMKGLREPIVVSPDMGGLERAKKFAGLLNTDYMAIKKHRDRKTGKVSIVSADGHDIKSRDAILIDDMISTGGSIVKATQYLKKQKKCNRVYVGCTHGVFVDGAEKKIKDAGVSQIVSTNTIPGKNSVVDVSGVIAKAID